MRIIIDKGIPFLEGVFGSGFEVLYLSPEEITKDSVRAHAHKNKQGTIRRE